jgi:hypothetical protein
VKKNLARAAAADVIIAIATAIAVRGVRVGIDREPGKSGD